MNTQFIHLQEKSGLFSVTLNEQNLALNLAREKLVADIQHTPATKEEIEALILVIENELEKYSEMFKPMQNLTIVSDIPALAEIARLGFGQSKENAIVISQEQIEQLFTRFSRVINGYPAKAEGLPESVDFAVYLTLIREIMHHWHIEWLRCE